MTKPPHGLMISRSRGKAHRLIFHLDLPFLLGTVGDESGPRMRRRALSRIPVSRTLQSTRRGTENLFRACPLSRLSSDYSPDIEPPALPSPEAWRDRERPKSAA